MSDPRIEKQLPREGEESDFGSRLKVRLAIAATLVALALAAIPVLDMLTGKKSDTPDSGVSMGSIASSAGLAATPPSDQAASGGAASAPTATASAPNSTQPSPTAPTGPDLSQTPGMTATPPLALPAASVPPTAAQQHHASPHAAVAKAHAPIEPPTGAHPASKAYKPGYQPSPYYSTAPGYSAGNTAPAAAPSTAYQAPLYQSQSPQAVAAQPSPQASLPAQPAGSSVGYNVQLGLFNNLENAQKLISELKSKGIQVQSETRVHLAPFRTRIEAEQAMAKLRAMGYAPLLDAAGN